MSHMDELHSGAGALSRRQFLQYGAFGAAALATGPTLSAATTTTSGKRPNILFIITDQQGLDTLSAYGCGGIHTPHLEDKYKGTRMTLELLAAESRRKPERVLIDHVEEHTIKLALDAGYWVGMTFYPVTKCTPERAVDMIERYGPDRITVNSAGDWGPCNPMNTPDFMRAMRARGHDAMTIHRVVYENPLRFFSQARNYNFEPPLPVT